MRHFLYASVAACTLASVQAADPAAAPQLPKTATAVSVAAPDTAAMDAVLAKFPAVAATYGDKQTLPSAEVVKAVRSFVAARAQQMGRAPTADETLMLARQMTESLVTKNLIMKQVEADGIKSDLAEGQKKLDELEAQNGKEQIEKGLQAQGMTRDELLKELAFSMAIDKWVSTKIKPQVKVSDEAVAKLYQERIADFQKPEQVRASHILVKIDAGADAAAKAAAKAKAEGILKQIQGGADFAALAKEKSDCPSKKDGGDLGPFARGAMVPEFEEAAFKLKAGEVSGVVETKYGYHIIKAVEHTPAETAPLDSVKDKIRTALEQQEMQSLLKGTIGKLRETANIKILLPPPPPPPVAAKPAAGPALAPAPAAK